MAIAFNKPFISGNELKYISEAVNSGKLAGNGPFTKKCQQFFEERYGFKKCLLTTSGTGALEMAAILTGVGPGDEVIVPSYTFVSSALAFARQGASIVFCDSKADDPNLDEDKLEKLITPRTKVIVPVHYAGIACDMDRIMEIAARHDILVVEDAAQGVDSYCKDRPLGGIGHLGCFSFHETKGVVSGEGGLLVINDDRFVKRSEIVWEKGTNRAEFFRGEVNKYGWVDMGGAFAPSELIAAFLWAQLESMDHIQQQRLQIWQRYYAALKPLADKGVFSLPAVPDFCRHNAHMFYLLFPTMEKRKAFMQILKDKGIGCTAHFLALHSSDYYRDKYVGEPLGNCDKVVDTICRLPLYCGLTEVEQELVIAAVKAAAGEIK